MNERVKSPTPISHSILIEIIPQQQSAQQEFLAKERRKLEVRSRFWRRNEKIKRKKKKKEKRGEKEMNSTSIP